MTFQKEDAGDVFIGGVSVKSLVAQYQTPLYVIDEATVRQQCRLYTQVSEWIDQSLILYASKANNNVGLLNVVADEGLGVDVVSGGELYTALKSRVKRDQIYFHGNNKSKVELDLAIENDTRIVVDHMQELALIQQLALEKKRQVYVMLRVKPEIQVHTHQHIQTGQAESKFGIEREELIPAVKQIQADPYLTFLGIHSHIGSQILESTPYEKLVDVMVEYLIDIRKQVGCEVTELNFGGGFGIAYLQGDEGFDVTGSLKVLLARFKVACQKIDYPIPKVLFEPGRSIVGSAGVTLYQVGAVKRIPDVKTFLFVDGGMADNPRRIMYQAEYEFDLVQMGDLSSDKESYSIAGKFCETGDILAENVALPKAAIGDIVVVYATGAYNYSMSSTYNRCCRPAMVMVNEGKSFPLIRRETYEHLIQHDVIEESS